MLKALANPLSPRYFDSVGLGSWLNMRKPFANCSPGLERRSDNPGVEHKKEPLNPERVITGEPLQV